MSVRQLNVSYGGIQAVKNLSLICTRGAGQSDRCQRRRQDHHTKAICGLLQPASGEVRYQGRAIKGQGAWELVSQGLVMVPEGRGIFTRMTIEENLRMGAYLRRDAEVESDIEAIYTRFPRLKERHRQLAGTLSGGEQQMLAMGRALLAKPKLLLLDEPSMGLAPIMVEQIFQVVQDVPPRGDRVVGGAERSPRVGVGRSRLCA